ncbi:MAG: hypothetical protein KF770_17525 [Anaerolineae bacterium]|nr:hypothetical protein [Anaerolineae bacterium]
MMEGAESQESRRIRETIMEAVRQAIQERDIALQLAQEVAAREECQQRLTAAEYRLAHVEQTLLVYQTNASLRETARQYEKEELARAKTDIASLQAQVTFLQSALMNQSSAQNSDG